MGISYDINYIYTLKGHYSITANNSLLLDSGLLFIYFFQWLRFKPQFTLSSRRGSILPDEGPATAEVEETERWERLLHTKWRATRMVQSFLSVLCCFVSSFLPHLYGIQLDVNHRLFLPEFSIEEMPELPRLMGRISLRLDRNEVFLGGSGLGRDKKREFSHDAKEKHVDCSPVLMFIFQEIIAIAF